MTRSPHRMNRRNVLRASATTGLGLAFAQYVRANPAAAQDAVNLEFWDMVWGPPEYIDTGTAIAGQYAATGSGTQVDYRSTPWTNWYQTFTTAIGAGTAPDVSTGAGYQAVQFYDQGAVATVDDLVAQMQADGTAADFLPGTIERLQYDGHYVALPWAIDIRVLYYRKDLFAAAGVAPPTTWDEFAAAAKALTSGDQYGLVTAGADNGGSHQFYMFTLNNGGSVVTADRQANVLGDRTLEALQFNADLVSAGVVHPASTGYIGDDAVKAFGSGAAAMYMSNPGLENRFPELTDQVGVLAPLTGPHGDKGTVSWVNNVMLYEQSEHKEQARAFLAWWLNNLTPLWTDGHVTQLPVRQSIASNAYFDDKPNITQILEQWVPIGKSTGYPVDGIFPALNELEGEGVMQTLMQDILQGKDARESADKAQSRLESILS